MLAGTGRAENRASSQYEFKADPHSSHSLLLECMPAPGERRRVLDAGCAEGYLSAALDARGYDVTAIERPGVARELPRTVRLIEADLDEGLPPLDKGFAFIVCGDVLEHLRDPLRMLRQLRPLLAADGRLLVSVPNAVNIYARAQILAGRFPEHERGLFDRTHLHFAHFKRWVDMFARAGFRVESVRPTSIPFALAWPKLKGTAAARALDRLWFWLALIRKELFAYQFIFSACAAGEGEDAMAAPVAVRRTLRVPVLPRAESPRQAAPAERPNIVVVMPAYNAAKTLGRTYADLPHDMVDLVILVDDGSRDETTRIARELGLAVFAHNRNYGYGANQKTCYREALRAGAQIVVMVHPDYQYDPALLPQIVRPIQEGIADIVLGSRLMGINPMRQGMPWWKYYSNRFLTCVENWVFGRDLSEYHTGYRAFHRDVLESLNIGMNSDNFIFDQEIMAQAVEVGARIAEVPVPVRYHAQASSASFIQSSVYGLNILWLLTRYSLHRFGLRQRQFESLAHRYANESSGRRAGRG